jgi:glycosyltransferase involved in cell wall biosynthesis
MKIAYYNALLNEPWGCGTHAQGLVQALRACGHDVLCIPEPLAEDTSSLRPKSNRYHWVPAPIRKPAMDVRARLRVMQHQARLFNALREFRPAFVFARRAAYDYTLDALLADAPSPVVAEVNAVLGNEAPSVGGETLLLGETRRERRFLRSAAACVCISDEVAADVKALGVDPGKIVVLSNGVDTLKFSPSISPDPSTRELTSRFSTTIAYAGTLSPVHDMVTLLKAAQEVVRLEPSSGFLFIGATEDDLLPYGRSFELAQHLLCTGRVDHSRVPSMLACADLSWAAFRSDYVSPLKLFEYLAMGKPVVIAGTGQARDVTLASEGGLVVERGDWRGLAAAAVALMRADPARRATLGENARGWVQANATWERVAQRIVDEVAARLSLTER